MYKFVIFAFLLTFSVTNAFWTSCGGSATTHSVTSPSCDATRCTATRGQPLVSDTLISFTGAHQNLQVSVTAFILGVGVNLPVDPPHNNACNSLFLGATLHGCPTQANVQYNWHLNMDIPANLPAFQNTRVQCELFN